MLRDIFERSNSHKACQDISLTYRGQFVVSSRRMKQANQELLRDLRSRVIDDEHFGSPWSDPGEPVPVSHDIRAVPDIVVRVDRQPRGCRGLPVS